MARIAGVNIPLNKRVEVGLTYVYGIGRSTSNKILKQGRGRPDTYVKDLTEDEVRKLREASTTRLVEGDLRRERSQNVKRLMEIGVLSRSAAPARPARQRPAHEDQRAHPQGARSAASRAAARRR